MNIKIVLYAAFFAALFYQSCAPAYIPNVVNSPMLSSEKQINASLHGGASGFDIQSAYSPLKHLGIMVNGSYMDQTTENSSNYHQHVFFEGGPGYYMNMGKYGLLDAYAGLGFGGIDSRQTSGDFNSEAHNMIARVFVQPSLSFVSTFFEASLSARTVLVYIWQDAAHNTGYFFEPALTIKAGTPSIKVVAQAGISTPINPEAIHFFYQPFIFSLGIQARIFTGE